MAKIFIDGSAGTTGLRIRERLLARSDIELLVLPDELRKDDAARKEMTDKSDITFLCLPDAAAAAAAAAADESTVIIDTSTAHRVAEGWVYGMPELDGQRELIRTSKRISNPGCHASGFIALVEPLVQDGLILPTARLSSFSLTGYSGGGKSMIAQYEDTDRSPLLDAPRIYALTQTHKHIPEMVKMCGLLHEPVFSPIVADFYSGMTVVVSLSKEDIEGTLDDIRAAYRENYATGLIRYIEEDEDGFISAKRYEGRDDMAVSAYGTDEKITLIARFDNLGKGASGAAIQNMNIVLGVDETTGLNTK